MRRLGCLVLALTGAALLALPAPAREIDKQFHETFDVQKGVKLKLDHGDGDVSIEPWDQDLLEISVRYRADITKWGWGGQPDFDVEFSRVDSTIRVVGRETGGGVTIGLRIANREEHLYTVRGPRYLILDLIGEDGDVRVTGWEGEIAVTLDDGDLRLANIASHKTHVELEDGDLEIDGIAGELLVRADDGNVSLSNCHAMSATLGLEDGDLEARDCDGDFAIRVEDGNVRLLGLVAGRVVVQTEDGDVEIDLRRSTAPDIDVRSDDGNVSIDMAEGTSAEFSVDAGDARLVIDVPEAKILDRDKSFAAGTIGEAAGRIRVRTSDGRITLRGR